GAGDKSTFHMWDTASAREIFTVNELDEAPVASADGRRVILSRIGAMTELRNAETGALLKSWPRRDYWTLFSPDGKTVLATTTTRVAGLWSAETGEVVRPLSPVRNYVLALRRAFSPDGSLIVVGIIGDAVQIFDTTTGAEVRSINGQDWEHAIFSPDNRRIA